MLRNYISYVEKNKTGPLFHTVYKINSRQLEDLNMKSKTNKLLEDILGIADILKVETESAAHKEKDYFTTLK